LRNAMMATLPNPCSGIDCRNLRKHVPGEFGHFQRPVPVAPLTPDVRSGSRLGSVGGFTLGPLQPNKQTFIDANVTMTTCFNDRPASRLVERALRVGL
jgi:hypothetical protein